MPRPQGSSERPPSPVPGTVAVVGLGYVGLPTALALFGAGADVVGVDTSPQRLDAVARGAVDLLPVHHAQLACALESDSCRFTSDLSAIGTADAVIVCVPTPVDAHRRPDLGPLSGACAAVVSHAVPGQLLVLTSTSHVGTTRELLVEPLAARGLHVEDDVLVAFSPERIDPGNEHCTPEHTPRLVGGAGARSARAAELLAPTASRIHVVDGRAGLVVRGDSEHTLAVYGDTIVPAEGAREPLVIEGHCGVSAGDLSVLARRAAPTAGDGRVRAARVDGYLSLFNLSADEVETRVAVPQQGGRRQVYEGEQTVTREGIDYGARLEAASASLLAPRFTLTALSGRSLPSGLRVRVADGATLILSGAHCRLRIEAQGRGTDATVRGGRETRVTLRGAQAFPHQDHALGRNTFPTSPLPPGMSSPDAAVDGDPDTAWRPGRDGRMVVDLGTRTGVRWVEAQWRTGAAPAARVEFSTDGVRYQRVGALDGRGRVRRLTRSGSVRYVAVTVQGAPHAHDGLVRLSVG
ncbi:discoidin domain-containing protein [Streptomyces sp. NPDC001599]|uniref:discoidin domain-containing protein n=1 Tax=Streptomyces sp. NPDC001599 TaxID=3364591 RepID=UPI0036AF2790